MFNSVLHCDSAAVVLAVCADVDTLDIVRALHSDVLPKQSQFQTQSGASATAAHEHSRTTALYYCIECYTVGLLELR
jgi:hypothetical protein